MQGSPDSPVSPADMRVSYTEGTLDVSDLASTPLEQFQTWFAAATNDERVTEANAMVLATAARRKIERDFNEERQNAQLLERCQRLSKAIL